MGALLRRLANVLPAALICLPFLVVGESPARAQAPPLRLREEVRIEAVPSSLRVVNTSKIDQVQTIRLFNEAGQPVRKIVVYLPPRGFRVIEPTRIPRVPTGVAAVRVDANQKFDVFVGGTRTPVQSVPVTPRPTRTATPTWTRGPICPPTKTPSATRAPFATPKPGQKPSATQTPIPQPTATPCP
jgi:hypothetical protein